MKPCSECIEFREWPEDKECEHECPWEKQLRYEEWGEPKDGKQWKITFPEGCTVQVIIRTEETGKYDRVFQLFEDSTVAEKDKVIRWIAETIWQILIEKEDSEDNLPF